MFEFISFDHRLQDIHTLCHLSKMQNPPNLTKGQSGRVPSEGRWLCGQPVRACTVRINEITHHNKSEGRHIEFSSYSLYAIPYLVGTTSKGLSVLRNGNAMCENYEVSEVFLGSAEEGTNVTVLLALWDNLV